ncbi:6222_t:CDS:10 [Acaulospora colombiana]|uniref:6222_t:CDS:1 n=1 Tax=Acaulospora colombiana TaxID=27376 RepID=A0ACA9KGH6_9GLOM|nr:6222_t:CDS:10 [Acaulospora colombiana]
MGTFFADDVVEKETRRHDSEKERLANQEEGHSDVELGSGEIDFEERDDSNIYFTPETGNVVFASALDGWAFSESVPVVAYVSKMFAVPSDVLPENKRTQLTAEELREKGRIKREALQKNSLSEASSTSSTEYNEIPERLKESSDSSHVEIEENDTPDLSFPRETFIGFARLYSGTIRVGQKLYALGPRYDPAFPEQHCTEVVIENLYLMMGRELELLKEVPAGNVFGVSGLEGHMLKNGTLSSTKECYGLAGVASESPPIVRVALEPKDPSEVNKLIEGLRLLNQADPCIEVLVQETGEHVILTAGEVHLERCLLDLRERFAKIEIQVSPPIVPFRETIVPVSDTQQNKDANVQRGVVILSTPNKYCNIKIRAVPLPPNVTAFLNQHTITIKNMLDERQRGRNDSQSTEEYEDVSKEVINKNERASNIEKFFNDLESEFEKSADKEIWKNSIDNIWAFGPKREGPNILINRVPNYSRKSWRKNVNSLKTFENETSKEVSEKSLELTIRDFEEAIHTGFQLATKAGPLCAEPLMGVAYFLEDFKVPVNAESVDISEKIRKRTSGAASPQLIFSGFEMLNEDPFWVPTTEEELEDLGEKADRENLAKKYIESVRKRKGMSIDKKIVEHAEKQRTLKKK